MKLKSLILGLILLSLTIQVQAQTSTVTITCKPGVGADSIMAQCADDSLFTKNIISSVWVVAKDTSICNCIVPKVPGHIYWLRCKSKNSTGECITNISWVQVEKVAPSGCVLLLPARGTIIK